jgi:hypothetical protein
MPSVFVQDAAVFANQPAMARHAQAGKRKSESMMSWTRVLPFEDRAQVWRP